MKTDRICVKCGSDDLLRVPGLSQSEHHLVTGEKTLHPLRVAKFVCGKCGFIEEWVDSRDDLDKLRQEYQRDASSATE